MSRVVSAADTDVSAGALGRRGRARAQLKGALIAAWETETAYRRPFLWLAAAAGAGVVLYFCAAREPSLPFAGGLCFVLAIGAAALQGRAPVAHAALLLLACAAAGFSCAAWRTARVAAPIAHRLAIAELQGFVEEVELRPAGARFVLRVASASGLSGPAPRRARLTTRKPPAFAAGDFVALKARLMPPAHAALPGGYDFARDAYFMGIGAVGSALGRIELRAPPAPAPPDLRFAASIDRLRNSLAQRVYSVLGGDAGAIAAAMVVGKRGYLSESARDLIRRAGIFHIVTISGVQMTLVAGIFFVGLRRLLALSPMLALDWPIRKWAAGLAIAGAVFYDLFAGSRIGSERALVMTVLMLGAVLADRVALSMRNLAFAVLFVVAFEPEAILGAGFQLSFAAVAALIAFYEWRSDFLQGRGAESAAAAGARPGLAGVVGERLADGPLAALVATACATTATAAFMANDFHELSPYVLIGNPLTLAAIEFFAVPCALLGALLFPLGLDGPVWRWLGMGIDLVTRVAGVIAEAPGASLTVKSFPPAAMAALVLAVLSAALWRSALLRVTAIPLALVGLLGATRGETFDLAVAANGEAAALRLESGELTLLGRNVSAFSAEQWLRADGDGRRALTARGGVRCDAVGCVGQASDGRTVALAADRAALVEDCGRAAILVTPLFAPSGCAAPIVVDRRRLEATGAVTLRLAPDGVRITPARSPDEDRPWSPAPPPRRAETGEGDPPTREIGE